MMMNEICHYEFNTSSFDLLQTEKSTSFGDDNGEKISSNDEEMRLQSQTEVEYGRENSWDFCVSFGEMIRDPLVQCS